MNCTKMFVRWVALLDMTLSFSFKSLLLANGTLHIETT